MATITKVVEPKYFPEVVKETLWRKAKAEEVRALEENKTWIVEDLLQARSTLVANGFIE